MEQSFMFMVRSQWPERRPYQFGWGNGYVALPPGHPFYGVERDDIKVNVHGGLTYSQFIGRWYVIGFDTCHHRETLEKSTFESVFFETKRLLDQCIAVQKKSPWQKIKIALGKWISRL